ncbi:hypothetical protein AYO44_11465 [Planctomycetaceae bacterium SCGC AG-212-F19]|nr:hypothetical protein AYO44_11465 [Planctomycetaceae bacterium SCGC AG-212-F19]
MIPRLFLLLVGLFFLAGVGASGQAPPPKKFTPEQEAKLQEYERLAAEANNLSAAGKLAEAIVIGHKLVALERDLFGKDHERVVTALDVLSGQYEKLGNHTTAIQLREEIVAIRTRLYGADHWRVSESRMRVEDFRIFAKFTPDQRRRYYQAGDQNEQGIRLYEQLEYAKALKIFGQTLETFREVLGEKHWQTARVWLNLAAIHRAQGDYARPEHLARQAVEVLGKALGEKHPEYAAAMTVHVGTLWAMGDYAKAELVAKQVSAIYRQSLGANHAKYAQSLHNLALLYTDQKDTAKAEALYKQALEIRRQTIGEKHPEYASNLNNLAALYHLTGDFAKAEPLARQAVDLRRQVLGENHPDFAASLAILAAMYSAQGDYAQAEKLYGQSMEVFRRVVGEKHNHFAFSLHNLGHLYDLQGDHAKAEPLYRQALDIIRANLDLCAAGQSERQQRAMTAIFRKHLDGYLIVSAAARASAQDAYGAVLFWKGGILARQRRARIDPADPKAAALLEELRGTTARLAALSFAIPDPRQRDAFNRQVAALSERKEQLEQELARLSAAFRSGQDLARLTPEQLQKTLPPGTALVDFLEFWHTSRHPTLKGAYINERRLVAFIVRPDQEIVRLQLGSAVPVTEAVEAWRQSLGERVRPVLSDRDPALTLRKLLWEPLEPHLKGAQLVLISPDEALNRLPFGALPGAKAGTFLMEETPLVLVPVPQLLPEVIAAGPAPKPGGSDAKTARPPSLLVIGDVDYGADPGVAAVTLGASREAVATPPGMDKRVVWNRLAATGPELEAVQQSFKHRFTDGSVVMLRDKAATESAFRDQAPRHRYLHLATHGFFADPTLRSALMPSEKILDQDRFGRDGFLGHHPGLLSGLVLAGANVPVQPDRDDGILTALEVADLDLRGVGLVVMSACETGLGATAGGEGVLGLQRAFQSAGARSVVASLWKVEDQGTAALMSLFYHKLWRENKSPVAALREAQLTIYLNPERIPRLAKERGPDFDAVAKLPPTPIKDPKAGTRAPVKLWAAFVLSGAWE